MTPYADKRDHAAQMRRWKAANPERAAAIMRRYRFTHPAQDAARKRRWIEQNREKKRAHRTVAKAVAAGRLVAPSTCPMCGADGKIEGHHLDYQKRLEVVWLCVRCHKKRHAAEAV